MERHAGAQPEGPRQLVRLTSQDSASAGRISRFSSGSTRVSKTFSSTSKEKYALVFCGSSWSGSPAIAAIRLPEVLAEIDPWPVEQPVITARTSASGEDSGGYRRPRHMQPPRGVESHQFSTRMAPVHD